MKKLLVRIVFLGVVTCVSLAMLEAAFRWIDGYAVFGTTLTLVRVAPAPSMAAYLNRFPLAPGVDPAWSAMDPETATGGITSDPDLAERERNSPPAVSSNADKE